MTTLKRRIIDWSLTGFIILVTLLVFRASLSRGTPSGFDQALLRITAPLQAGVSWVVEGVGGLWSRYVALVDIESENRELRAENEKLRRELAAKTRQAFDVAALEDLAVVKRRTPADTLGARVIGAPMSPQFRVLRLRIDRGDKEVQPGMPVITGTGPVGRINKVFGDYADVTLISDPSSSVEVVIPRTGGRGILTGMGRNDSYACKIEWLERQTKPESKVQVGDEIVTSGLGASFPPGLLVGKVSQVARDDGMFQKVEVAPMVDVSRVRAVEVLLAPPPPPDPDAKSKRKSEPAFGGRHYEGAALPHPVRPPDPRDRDLQGTAGATTGATDVRTATIVLVAYVVCVIVSAIWRFMPGFVADAVPAIGALTAAYLGHTSRPHRAPTAAACLVLGYLIDVMSGTPPGLTPLVMGMTSDVARRTQQRIFVRGTSMTIGFSAFVALIASLAQLFISAISGIPRASTALELQHIALIAISTALVGPLVWKLFRRIDAAYARTSRERDHALEGLAP